jgi:hypothetical protein
MLVQQQVELEEELLVEIIVMEQQIWEEVVEV